MARRKGQSHPEICGNPFRPVTFAPFWRTPTAVGIAKAAYEDRAFELLPHYKMPGLWMSECWGAATTTSRACVGVGWWTSRWGREEVRRRKLPVDGGMVE